MEEFLKQLVQDIVKQAKELKDKHTRAKDAPVNYACIFSQSEEEYNDLISEVKNLGYTKIAQETKMGPVFLIEPIDTVAGQLKLLKIRRPDEKRKELGDADFTVKDYPKFKKDYLNKEGWGLIEREDFEMMELQDKEFNVLAYFSHPTLGEVLNLNI